MKLFFGTVVVVLGLFASAAPTVSFGENPVVQDPETRVVTVNYTLSGERGIVTAELMVNGEVVPGMLNTLAGDIARELPTGAHSFTWLPDREGFTGALSSVSFKLTAWSLAAPPDYMVVDMLSLTNVWHYPNAASVPQGVGSRLYKTDRLLMRKIPAANVLWLQGMASPTNPWNQTNRWCTLTKDYYIGVYEMTRRQHANLIDDASAHRDLVAGLTAETEVLPMASAQTSALRGPLDSGYDWPGNGHTVSATTPLGTLRARTGLEFDLPTVAQWEYACRAGTSGATYGPVADVAQTEGVAGTVCEVGLKLPNAWGLYDTLGNLFELCLDWVSTGASTDTAEVVDPKGPEAYEPGISSLGNGGRHWRGGCPGYSSYATATAVYCWGKDGSANVVGYRLCCPIAAQSKED